MAEYIYRTQLRLPNKIYARLKAASEQSGRSLNAEIVHRVEESFNSKHLGANAGRPPERQKTELLLDFERWSYSKSPLNEKVAYSEYCRLYNGDDPDQEEVEHVYGIEKIDPRFLIDLALAMRRYARESTYVLDPTRAQRIVDERRKCDLLIAYLRWCKERTEAPQESTALVAFCAEYNSRESGKILDLEEIFPGYLEELVSSWLCCFPVQLAGANGGESLMQEALKAMHKQQVDTLQAIESAMRLLAPPD
ncbi:Arc family DNA-binding protein [Pseudogulbenkiania subflava]|uniref:Arc-like DNA binding domain-containing protein n=1 Tax=Pseudogulbenkiania subflava DSM 22618 TaxID=1123014 RepID=A0A1Y6CDV1_9NEIS|nr:Arc family DNA-binding protein [Pseudogulbenkiania subflava]SMF56509.1 Arc-like DNA binding domain-containing protein [Pseudogulbenkiania subflava DSM 22618]